jgi:hypothetical protein
MAQNQSYTIGEKIKAVLKEQRRSAIWLADQLNCNRVNIYDIFERQTIDTELLMRISLALEYDFFGDFSKDFRERIEDVK